MSNTQDLGNYIPEIRASGIRLNRASEPMVLGANSAASFAGTVTMGGVANGTPASLASAATVAFTPSTVLTTHTPTQSETINFSTPGAAGTEIFLEVVTSGVSSFTLTFGTNTKSTGTLATGTVSGKTFVVSFVSDGTNWVETSRTTAM